MSVDPDSIPDFGFQLRLPANADTVSGGAGLVLYVFHVLKLYK